MSLSKTLYKLQQIDSEIDLSLKRIDEIELLISDSRELSNALKKQEDDKSILDEKHKDLKSAEYNVEDQNLKIDQNQKKLYGGAITNPKELEDLQLESTSLQKYLSVLEERQLEAMLDYDQALADYNKSTSIASEISEHKQAETQKLSVEKDGLEAKISALTGDRIGYLESTTITELPIYERLRKSSGGIAVAAMVEASCTACGAHIPSAIEQEARSTTKLAFCPTCKRILHPK
jgi:predicted  nucleic acid-binding Zn-ribbon protein